MRNDPRSHGLWSASAPPPPPTTSLSGELLVDVAVVGAGFTGCSAALHLAEGGVDVAVLEAEEIGFGGSGRNVGLVNAGMWVMPDDLPGELGEVHGERLLRLLGEAPRAVFDIVERHGIDCEAERQGTLHCAVGEKGLAELRERERQWRARGAPVRLLGAAETEAKVGTAAYAGALLDERAGTIQPLAYARGLARAAIGAGAALFTSSPVVSAADEGGMWILRTPNGTVRARRVVVATDAYAAGVWPEIRCEQVHLPYFNMATPPLGDNLRRSILPERQGAWDTKEILSSFRFDQAGRLVFGSVGALRGGGQAVHRDWGRRALARLFPQLAGIDFEYQWYGKIGMTGNSLPRFHRLAREVVAFSGYNGRGIAPGTVFGRCLADLLLGRIGEDDLPLPVTPVEAAPRRALREAYYEVGAQIAHLAGARF
ncbi:FAD-binding oxidoreductase [Aureimonas sp. SK2]|uniref:NAD(P)/FAD-dependent oxidoreductase n=1 Tax=Aureimonas sp. SK2 TaxID=3015992 RepID=UPI0024440AB8|nr:FAD-binding oxidoreductase [Aureimonas sp. SK2]